MSLKKPKLLDPMIKNNDENELEDILHERIVGQEKAIAALVKAYEIYQSGLNDPTRPISNLVFLGPTGSGKTLSVEVMSEALFGTTGALLKVDCSEFQHSHEIAKLVGSPPGYLGHRETKAYFAEDNLNRCHTDKLKLTLLLLDEFEKANDALWNLLLGIMDKGAATMGTGERVSFDKCIIVMTGNLGAQEIEKMTQNKMGFAGAIEETEGNIEKGMDTAVNAALRKRMNPEFINRLDDVIVFHSLNDEQLQKVVDIEINRIQARVLKSRNGKPFILSFTKEAKLSLLSKGTDKKYGARPLKRAIEKHIVHSLSRLLITEQIKMGDHVLVDEFGESFSFTRVEEGVLKKEDVIPVDPATTAISALAKNQTS